MEHVKDDDTLLLPVWRELRSLYFQFQVASAEISRLRQQVVGTSEVANAIRRECETQLAGMSGSLARLNEELHGERRARKRDHESWKRKLREMTKRLDEYKQDSFEAHRALDRILVKYSTTEDSPEDLRWAYSKEP